MRPWEREQEVPPPEPSPVRAAPRTGGNLSSMVVRPSDSGGGGSDFEPGEVNNRRRDPPPMPLRRRVESPPLDLHRRVSSPAIRRRDSPSAFRRRDSPLTFHRHNSPPDFPRRVSPPDFHRRRGTPPMFHSRSQRFHENPGYLPHAGSISPPSGGQRLDDSDYDPDFDHPAGPRFGRGYRGGRGGGRFRDISPHYGRGRGGRSIGRGYNVGRRGVSPIEGEYVHRNDPNLSPREGDWICRNPSCGNLNFARRTHCNNCNKYRYGPGDRPSRSPRREYFSPPPHGPPPSIAGPPMDRGLRRDINGYRSPPRGWGAEDPRDFGAGSPPPRRGGGRFQDHMRKDNVLDYEDDYRGRGKFDWPVGDEWDQRGRERGGFISRGRGYDRHPPSPHNRWVQDSRERSRSPIGGRPLKGSYMGQGRDYRRYDDSYMGRGRADESDVVRGRGFRRGNKSFIGQGRGDRRGMARGRNNSDMY